MELEKIIEKITQYRNRKGYTYENMAHDLHITPAAYRKIETGETKLTVERLFKIADILESPFTDFALLTAKASAPETAKALTILVERGFRLLKAFRLSLVALLKADFWVFASLSLFCAS